jgi:hypothetical protein
VPLERQKATLNNYDARPFEVMSVQERFFFSAFSAFICPFGQRPQCPLCAHHRKRRQGIFIKTSAPSTAITTNLVPCRSPMETQLSHATHRLS